MNKEELTEKIEQYLDGELQGKELIEFEDQINGDKTLKQEVELHKYIRMTISDEETSILRYKIKRILSKSENSRSKFNKRKTAFYLSGMLVILLVIASVLFSLWNNGISTEDLYAQYYKKYDSGIVFRDGSENVNFLQQGIVLYNKGDYNNAITYFENGLELMENSSENEFFLGLTYMEKGLYTKAIQHFEANQLSDKDEYRFSSLWYSGLCYLKLNNQKKALEYFQIQVKENSDYAKIAEQIIQKLEK